MKKDSIWKRMNWLLVAGVLTVAYGIAIELTLGWDRTRTFFTDDTDLNEIGDFLAGVFAPVALLWLVAAVFTQRQELNETRDQFEENQKVVDAQLKTINAQNALLSLQHEQAVANAKQQYKLSLFERRFAIYSKFMQFERRFKGFGFDNLAPHMIRDVAREAAFVFDRSIADWMNSIAQKTDDYLDFRNSHPATIDTLLPPDELNPNHELEAKYRVYTDWIHEQFTPAVTVGKFWDFLYVSDQPHIEG
ncbi:hypothetical protein [Ensifer sp. SL37]|uniref:hypothetical protein n=1 Tax=Ensifer sp. SL37 TaxID=2995137 RepID=UPI002276AD73|nr:hypothetical protein [Ensifer sp. SL37]MCY1740383.1 hypothetical protein [Ensifer sp. SL37]